MELEIHETYECPVCKYKLTLPLRLDGQCQAELAGMMHAGRKIEASVRRIEFELINR